MKLLIRTEEPQHIETIQDLIRRAFAPMPFGDNNDQHLTNRFRSAGVLSLSLVAEKEGVIAGHVALTPAVHESGAAGWFALGPLAVEPHLQRRGIGTALIAEAKAWLASRGAAGCIVMGDTNYYPRHGFLPAPETAPVNEPAAYFMVLAMQRQIPPGSFAFHPLFYTTEPPTSDSPSTSD
jgi:putative acetyltransferase